MIGGAYGTDLFSEKKILVLKKLEYAKVSNRYYKLILFNYY